MAQLSKCHKETKDGVGKCSVPMWMDCCPAGFCDRPAYGPQEPSQRRSGKYGAGWVNGRWFAAGVWRPTYCSGLACPEHGGPEKPGEEAGDDA